MRLFTAVLVSLAILSIAKAMETRTEVTNTTTPAEDSKPNSDAVPDVYAAVGQFERIVVLRFKYEADLLEGIERIVKEQNIHNGVILAGAGAVKSYHYHLVSNVTFPSKNIFVKNTDAPADITGMNGYIIDGRIHSHVTFTDADKGFGGHLERGTKVFTFAAVTIGVFKDGVDLKHLDDKSYR